MNNYLQKQNNWFYKIRGFFINLFKKSNKREIIITGEQEQSKSEPINEKNEIQNLREEYQKNQETEKLIQTICNNPDCIDNWPIEKLERLEKLFDKKIEEYDNDILELKKRLST